MYRQSFRRESGSVTVLWLRRRNAIRNLEVAANFNMRFAAVCGGSFWRRTVITFHQLELKWRSLHDLVHSMDLTL